MRKTRQGKAKNIACNVSKSTSLCGTHYNCITASPKYDACTKQGDRRGAAAKRYRISRELRNVIRVRYSIRGTGMVMQTNKER